MRARGTLAQIVTASVVTLAALYFFRGVLAPFFLAVVIAIVVDAIADAVHRTLPGVPRWGTMVLLGLVVTLLIVASFGVVLRDATKLAPQADSLVSRLQDAIQAIATYLGLGPMPDLKVLLASADLSGALRAMLASATDALSSLGLVVLFLAFVLASRVTLDSKVTIIAASTGRAQRVRALLDLIARGVQECVLLQAVGAGLIAVASAIVLAAVGLHDAPFWGIAIFLVSYLPFVGGLLAGIVPALFALVQFPTAWPAVIIFGAIQVINVIVGNFVMPKLQAAGPNIDPTAGILTFCVLSVLWGIPGAILASPLTVMLMLILAHFDSSRWLAVLISNDGHPATSADAPVTDAELFAETAGRPEPRA